jgi:hypothetical protein
MQQQEKHRPAVTLKHPVYALHEPVLGAYIAARDENKPPRLAPLHLATLAPVNAECREKLVQLASRRLAGVPHEIVRVDA